jgi:flagellar motor switch protein FliM
MDPDLVFALIDRLLGGPGLALPEARALTDIEKGLMARGVERVAECIADAWRPVAGLQPVMDTMISGGLFGQSALPDDRIALVRFTVCLGGVSGAMRLGIPVSSLSPVLSRLNTQQRLAGESHAGGEGFSEAIRQSLEPAEVMVSVELGRAAMTVRDLLDLQVGDLVCLKRKTGDDLDVRVGSLTRFQGQPGQVGRRLGLRITRSLDGEEE